jgi:amidase
MQQAQKKGPLTETEVSRRIGEEPPTDGRSGHRRTVAKYSLDAIVAPTQGPAWLIDLVNGDPGGLSSFTSPAAVAGYPHVTVPMGFVRGLPVGLSFVGRAWSEPTLLKLAYAFEQTAPARRKPTFAATAEIGETRRPT